MGPKSHILKYILGRIFSKHFHIYFLLCSTWLYSCLSVCLSVCLLACSNLKRSKFSSTIRKTWNRHIKMLMTIRLLIQIVAFRWWFITARKQLTPRGPPDILSMKMEAILCYNYKMNLFWTKSGARRVSWIAIMNALLIDLFAFLANALTSCLHCTWGFLYSGYDTAALDNRFPSVSKGHIVPNIKGLK